MIHEYRNNKINALFSLKSIEQYLETATNYQTHEWFSVFIVNSLDGYFLIDDSEFRANSPSVLFLTPGQIISTKNINSCKGFVVSFNKEFYCIEYHDNEISCNGLLFVNNFNIVSIKLDNQQKTIYENTINEISNELNSDDEMKEEMLKNLLKNLLIRSNRLFKQQHSENEIDESSFDLIRRFSSFIEIHFKEQKSVGFYADLLGISASSLTKKLQKTSLQSPSIIIRDRIITEAKRLIIYSDKNIKEIAAILGYADQYYFSRLFTTTTGISPSKYRSFYLES